MEGDKLDADLLHGGGPAEGKQEGTIFTVANSWTSTWNILLNALYRYCDTIKGHKINMNKSR